MTPGLNGFAGPNKTVAFREIDELEQLGRVAAPHHLSLGVKMLSRPAAPLFDEAALPQRVLTEHAKRLAVPGAGYLGVTGHELGGFGLLQQRGRVFVDDRVQPRTMNSLIQPDQMPRQWIRGLLAPDAEIVESELPVGLVLNPHLVWGHVLMEMMGRVRLLAKLRSLGHPVRVAVPLDAPGWIREFIALYFPAAEMLLYDSRWQRVRAPCFVLPGMMMADYVFHPELNAVVQDTLDRAIGRDAAGPSPPQRLYLSRRRHDGWHALANEAEIEATLLDFGFTIVHPQELTIRAQLELYARAACIVSLFGSTAHNALFAPFGTPTFCFGWMNNCQSGISALRGQPLAYMKPSGGDLIYPPEKREPGVFTLRIDCRDLAQELAAFLRFAEMRKTRRAEAPAVQKTPPAIAESGTDRRISAELMTAAPWLYGWEGKPPTATQLRFLPDGGIQGYDHPNERRWSLKDGVFSILGERGQTTVMFDRYHLRDGRIVLRGPYQSDPPTGIILRLERAS